MSLSGALLAYSGTDGLTILTFSETLPTILLNNTVLHIIYNPISVLTPS